MKINRTVRRISSFVLMLSVFFMSATMAGAATITTENVDLKQDVNLLKEELLEVSQYTHDLKYIEETQNIDQFKNAIQKAYPSISDYELGKLILMSLGDSEEYINSLPIEKVCEAVDYVAATKVESYLHETQNGEFVEISKDLFYTKECSVNYSAASTRITDYEETFGDIVLRTYIFERYPEGALPGRNYYGIRGEVEWIGFPNFQLTDMLVISSSGNIDNNYAHCAFGTWSHGLVGDVDDTAYLYPADGGAGSFLTLGTPDLYGLSAEFPIGILQQDQVIVKKVVAYYGVTAQKDITCQVSYAHAILAWNPSVSISTGGAVSFGGLGVQRQVFNGIPYTVYYD